MWIPIPNIPIPNIPVPKNPVVKGWLYGFLVGFCFAGMLVLQISACALEKKNQVIHELMMIDELVKEMDLEVYLNWKEEQ